MACGTKTRNLRRAAREYDSSWFRVKGVNIVCSYLESAEVNISSQKRWRDPWGSPGFPFHLAYCCQILCWRPVASAFRPPKGIYKACPHVSYHIYPRFLLKPSIAIIWPGAWDLLHFQPSNKEKHWCCRSCHWIVSNLMSLNQEQMYLTLQLQGLTRSRNSALKMSAVRTVRKTNH